MSASAAPRFEPEIGRELCFPSTVIGETSCLRFKVSPGDEFQPTGWVVSYWILEGEDSFSGFDFFLVDFDEGGYIDVYFHPTHSGWHNGLIYIEAVPVFWRRTVVIIARMTDRGVPNTQPKDGRRLRK